MGFHLVKIIQILLMPPALMFLIMLAGGLLMRYSRPHGKRIVIAGFALLVLASLPVMPALLTPLMEDTPPLAKAAIRHTNASAIVVLGGGSYPQAPEYGNDTVSTTTLERLRYAAYLHRQTNLPVLVSGGRVFKDNRTAEATSMRAVLENEFSIPVRWTEDQARNTWENAGYSRQLLARENIKRIILVTHAMHMPRSILCFEAAGFEVVPAPMGYHTHAGGLSLRHFLPDARALSQLNTLMHEIIGILWYRLRYL